MAMRVVGDSRIQRLEKGAVIHPGILFGTALMMTNSQTEAEDLVHETCLYAYGFCDRFQQDTNCKSWLSKARRKLQNEFWDWAMANGYALEGDANESA